MPHQADVLHLDVARASGDQRAHGGIPDPQGQGSIGSGACHQAGTGSSAAASGGTSTLPAPSQEIYPGQ